MTQWYVKDLSQMTSVSVQTLHHYDRIDLLKPSVRLPNGYRLYSERDLLRLQQILALKFFGFKLTQIDRLLTEEVDAKQQLILQASLLEEKARLLLETSQTLKQIIAETSESHSISWEKTIRLIEVYRMTQKLEKTWVADILNKDELKQYAEMKREQDALYEKNPEKLQHFIEERTRLIEQIQKNLEHDPKSAEAYDLAQSWMQLINSIYVSRYGDLKQIIWERGFKQGKVCGEQALDPKVIQWLDKAVDHFHRTQISKLLQKIAENIDEKEKLKELTQKWHEIMEGICGDSIKIREEIKKEVLKDREVTDEVKQWLLQL